MGILKTAFWWSEIALNIYITTRFQRFQRVLVLPLSFQRYTIMLLLLSFIKLPLFCWKVCSPLNIYHAVDSDCVNQSDAEFVVC